MYKLISAAGFALLFSIAGCKEGAPAATRDDSPSPPVASVDPPPVSSTRPIGCQTLSFDRTTETDALPGGIWFGSLVDCERDVAFGGAVALVSEDGRFRILGDNSHVLSGRLTMSGDVFNGSGLDFAAEGSEYFSGPTTSMFVQGRVSERERLEGRWGTEWGPYGYFSFEYQSDAYEEASTFDALVGVWSMGATYSGKPVEGVWTVEPDGRFNGQDDSGCLQSGSFALIDDRYSLVEVELAVTGCVPAGSYSGLAYRQGLDAWWNAGVTISVDDGQKVRYYVLTQ